MNATLLQHNNSARHSGARKLVGLERHYHCGSCSGEHRSWSRLRVCPDCGEGLTQARIRRAALV